MFLASLLQFLVAIKMSHQFQFLANGKLNDYPFFRIFVETQFKARLEERWGAFFLGPPSVSVFNR